MPYGVHRLSEIDAESRTGICAHCGRVKLKPKKRGTRWACSEAEKRWKNDRGAAWRLTPRERDAMRRSQEGRCAICQEERKLVVDHCHASERVRGLLCIPCNSALGRLELGGWLERAQLYLARNAQVPRH